MKKCVDTSSSMSVQDVTFTACEDGMWGWGDQVTMRGSVASRSGRRAGPEGLGRGITRTF